MTDRDDMNRAADEPSPEPSPEPAQVVAAESASETAEQSETPAADSQPEPAENKPSRRWSFPWKTTVALLVVLVLAWPVFSTLQPAYYSRYPQLKVRMDYWSGSTHARIPCSGCHVDPGPLGLVAFSARAIPAFYSQLIFGPNQENILQTPHAAACRKCHTDYRQISPAGDLLIPHRAHVVVLGIGCPVCHKNLVHSLNAQGFNKPEMQTCLSLCHNGVKATNQCNKCHTQKIVPPSHLAKDWLSVHPTMVGKIDCAKCHAWAPNYCRECHSHRPPSHVGNWKQEHQFRAKAIGTKGCLFCHGQTFCNKCH